MRTPHHAAIRAALQAAPDGLSVKEISAITGIRPRCLNKSIETCFGVYVDRFRGPVRGQWIAIYVVVAVPTNAPKPERKKS